MRSSWATACSAISAGRALTRTKPSARCGPGWRSCAAVAKLTGGGQALACRVGHCYRARGRRRCGRRGVVARGDRSRRDPEPRRPASGHRTARGGRDRHIDAAAARHDVRARGSRATIGQGFCRHARRLARAGRTCCRQPLRGAHDQADTAGRARGGGGASRRALAAGPTGRRPGGAALRANPGSASPVSRAPSTSGSMACRSSALRHQCSPYYVDTPLHPLIEHLEQAAGFATGRSARRQGWTNLRPCWQRRRIGPAMRRR